jgi:pilus assembly protein CpaB
VNRNIRTLIVVGIALVFATGATFSVYRVIRRIPVRQVEVASSFAVVAAHSLPLGTRLTKMDVKLVAWPARDPIPGSFSNVDQVLNRGLITPVSSNEPLTEEKVAPLEAGSGLPPTIPSGMRAISVKVNEVIGVAGFVVPGTRVDVISIFRRGSNDSVSRVIVSNAQVLTAGTKFDQEMAKEGKAVPSTVVTLLVNSHDAERIGLAASEGQIMLTLRNPLDVGPSTSDGIRMATLLGTPPAPEPVAAPAEPKVRVVHAVAPPVEAPKRYLVEAIRASKRTDEVVRP